MGFLDRLLGREEPERQPQYSSRRPDERSEDQIAVERYRYLLRTAPPEAIEQVHTEAFSKLTPEQRELLFQQLSADTDASERPRDSAPASLAQAATRQELRNPGTMERTLGSTGQRGGMGMGFGGTFASSLLGTVTGFVIGSAIASAFLPDPGATDASGADGGGDAGADGGGDAGGDAGGGDAGADSGGDFGGGDFGGGDFGGGFGGGDFGGGDFGI
jgi:hypothetical protein